MTKYRVFINRDLCVDCGIDAGRCPTHARLLSRLLSDDRVEKSQNTNVAIIPEDLYQSVKRAAEGCPAKAIIVEKIE
jgi:ferredoxin